MTFEQFRHFIGEFSHTPLQEITETASFRDDLGIDSLQMVNLVVGLTSHLKLGLDAVSSSDDLSTVGRLYQAMMKDGNS